MLVERIVCWDLVSWGRRLRDLIMGLYLCRQLIQTLVWSGFPFIHNLLLRFYFPEPRLILNFSDALHTLLFTFRPLVWVHESRWDVCYWYRCVETVCYSVMQDVSKRMSLPMDIRLPPEFLKNLQVESPEPCKPPLSRMSRRASLVSTSYYLLVLVLRQG